MAALRVKASVGVASGTLGPSKATITISGHLSGRRASGVVEETPSKTCVSGPHVGVNSYQETFSASAK